MLTPRTYAWGKLGHLANLLSISDISKVILLTYGVPSIVWCYNGYAFESRISGYFKRHFGSRIILEFEDWHFARHPGFNPKPYFDWLFWRLNLKHIDYGFSVNRMLAEKLESFGIPTQLLPGVIYDWVFEIAESHPPFPNQKPICIGYFGGLTIEKGAGLILALIDASRATSFPSHFTVTGKGELESHFRDYSTRYPQNLSFMGAVTEQRLRELVAQTDVILNPHQISTGIFPFKVLESVSTGRLLISTQLNLDHTQELLWLNNAILTVEPNVPAFLDAIRDSYNHYNNKKPAIMEAVTFAKRIYSKSSLKARICHVLQTLNCQAYKKA
jgi:hypothetical protein